MTADLSALAAKADLFRSLHTTTEPLRLANAWDVASARVIEAAGATAIATTSAGVAWSLGAPDGNRLERDRALDLVARIAAAVQVPVTADIEAGFADDAAGVAATVEGLLQAGAVGVNIEDGSRPPAELADRIAVARATADTAGVPLFINARIDVFLFGLGEPQSRLQETLNRARTYLAAGADGIFVPGTVDAETVAALAEGVDAPLNVLVGPGAPNVGELGKLGAARVSLGSGIAQSAYAAARRAAEELMSAGTYDSISDALDYGELNSLMPQ